MISVHRGPLSAGEAERLSRLMTAAFTERDRGWSAAELAALSEDPATMFVTAAQGFAAVREAADEAEVLTVAVAPEQRAQGLGRRLLETAFAELRASGAATVFLEVGVGNVAARALYERLGFTEAGRRSGYLRLPDGTREDALVLTRRV